jgi:protein ImuB
MEKKFLSLYFPFLVTDWISLKKPGYKHLPLVVTCLSQGRSIITNANSPALSEGIHPGMVLADARALLPGILAMNERPGMEETLLRKIAEWCIRFTPLASIDLPQGIILDASGCTHLWGGDQAYLGEITKKIRARGYAVFAALAPTIGAAYALARFQKEKQVFTGSDWLNFLLPLPPEALRLENDSVEMLYKLGLRTMRDFVGMPSTVLMNRFGKQLNYRIGQMLGKIEEPLQPVCPTENFQERLPCLEPIITRKGIEIALEECLRSLIVRLNKEGIGIRKAVFRIYKLDGVIQEIGISTHKPSVNLSHILKLFSIRIDDLNPDPGIELFILESTAVEKTLALQEEIWEGAGTLQSVEVSELLDRISARIGAESISRHLPAEHHWPERSLKKAGSLDEVSAISWGKGKLRPVELLKDPIPIEVTAPIPDYPPMLFKYRGKLHRIKKADGPERIEREWWLDEGEHRDYYSLEDEEGKRFWVFRSGHYSEKRNWQWFLCGFFA